MLKTLTYFVPLAALVALASVMAFVPKIGPIVLVCAAAAATVAHIFPVRRLGWSAGLEALRQEAGKLGSAKQPVLAILLFMALCAASLIWVADANFALSRTIRLLGFFLAVCVYGLMVFRNGATDQKFIQPLAYLAIAGFCLAAMCLALSFNFIVPAKASPDAFVNRAVVILSLSIFAFAAYICSSTLSRAAKSTSLLVLATVALWFSLSSNSQTSTVALICGGLAAVVFMSAKPVVRRLFVIAIACFCFAMPFIVKIATSLPQSVFTLPFFQHGSAGQRLLIWDSYLALVREKPFFGWGVEGSRDFDPNLLASPVTATQNLFFTSHPHNAMLQIWTDLGLAGALLFSTLIALLGLRIEMARDAARAPIYGLFVGTLTTSAVSHGAFQSWWLASIAILAVSIFPLAEPKSDHS